MARAAPSVVAAPASVDLTEAFEFLVPPHSSPALVEAKTEEHTVPEQRGHVELFVDTTSSAEGNALFEGSFEGSSGPALLVSLLAQELPGRLELFSRSKSDGALYFFAGEPVWAVHPDGDLGLAALLIARGALPPNAKRPTVPEGQLLSRLVADGLISGQAMHNVMRDYVRERVLYVAQSTTGTYAFFEDASFVETLPLLKVNPIGLLLEARRRKTPPDELMRQASVLEWKYPIAGPALVPTAPKLKAFVRSHDLAELINGKKRVKQMLATIGMDALMGTLLLLTLEEARLISLSDDPQEELPTVKLSDSTSVEPNRLAVPDSDIQDTPTSREETNAREEIFSLYMRLKPLTLPREVLDVSLDAPFEAIQSAYEARVALLDRFRIPEGSAQQLMLSRVEELRGKVQRAYDALAAQAGRARRK
jgi:hypothetical protein